MTEEALHRLIGTIYNAALEPELPMTLLQQAAGLTGSTAATNDVTISGLGFADAPLFGTDSAHREQMNELFERHLYPAQAHRVRAGTAILGRQLTPFEMWAGNPIMHDVWIPAGTVHLLHLSYESHLIAGLSLWRGLKQEPHGARELRLGNILARHLRGALKFGQRFRLAADLSRGLAAAMDSLAIGCVLVEADGRLVQANAAAVAILEGSEALCFRAGRLAASRQNVSRWRRLLGALASDPPIGTVVTLEASTRPLVLHSVPLSPIQSEHWGVPLRVPALGLVLLIEPGRPHATPEQVLAAAFGLTPVESDLAAALLRDERLAGYAARRGRSLNTVRTHLKALFAKTDTHRQSELVRRLAAISLIDRSHLNG